MQERDLIIKDYELPLTWYRQAVFSYEHIIKMIEFSNIVYGFDLLDNDEELGRKAQEHKMIIKYKNFCVPLMSAIEEMLKSVLIAYRYIKNPDTFSRENVVYEIMRDVRREENSINGHDLFSIIHYINRHIDPHFLTNLEDRYKISKKRRIISYNPLFKNKGVDQHVNEDDVLTSTDEFSQGFIEFRYLFEKSETFDKNVDLNKLVQYGYAIQECCLNLLIMCRAALDIENRNDILNGVTGSDFNDKVSDIVSEVLDYVAFIMRENGVDFEDIMVKYNEEHVLKKILDSLPSMEHGVEVYGRDISFPVRLCFSKYVTFSSDEKKDKSESVNFDNFLNNIVKSNDRYNPNVEDSPVVPMKEIVESRNCPNSVEIDSSYSRKSAEELLREMNELLAEAGTDDEKESVGIKK